MTGAAMAKGHAKEKTFSPMPARAMADQELTALDLRILMALAAHDRFGANGIGCYASHKRLAEIVDCHVKSLSRSLNLLAERGYVEGRQHPLMKRLRVYRVLYTAEDAAMMGRPIGNEPVTNGGRNDGAERVNSGPIGNEPVPDEEPIGNRDFQEPERSQRDAHAEYILRSKEIYPAEAEKSHSVETASPCGAAGQRSEGEDDPDGRFLAQTERRLKAVNDRELTTAEFRDLRSRWERCEEIESARANDRDDVHFWAQRLVGEIWPRLEEWEATF